MSNWKIQTNTLNGLGAYKTTYTYGNERLYVMIPYEESVLNAIKKINEILNIGE